MIRLVTLFILVIATQASAQDWPQWRGPNRDGLVTVRGDQTIAFGTR